MTTKLLNNCNLEVDHEELRSFNPNYTMLNGNYLSAFFRGGDISLDLFGFLGEAELDFLDDIARKKVVCGECVCVFEGHPDDFPARYVKCKFDKDGFHYTLGRVAFDKGWER